MCETKYKGRAYNGTSDILGHKNPPITTSGAITNTTKLTNTLTINDHKDI